MTVIQTVTGTVIQTVAVIQTVTAIQTETVTVSNMKLSEGEDKSLVLWSLPRLLPTPG